MIQLLPGLPDNIIGISASGQVSASDYETVFVPAVEAALCRHQKVRLFYQLDSTFSGFTVDAMWDDLKLGVGHIGAWEKVALVTDVEWVAKSASLFRFAMPCPMQVFSLADRAKAEAWITA